ncbi:MAG: tRNA preQ1(34) S-adenosylmethionine ribosyltransferase-isomerase QueA [Candidatus Rokubacteria bacterium]|nr:tRNA preQ1(34) S-adenosylmethionine ribosyltransferase-isomerase QueA [Candidatus Rokubacteria bacterium]
MDLAEFDYELPPSAIAQRPAPSRDGSRLLLIDRARGALEDHAFAALPDLLRPGDCLVVNDSRVIPARVLARDVASGRDVEVLFLEPEQAGRWWTLVRPGRRACPGTELAVGGAGGPRLRVAAVGSDGRRVVERLDGTIPELLDARGMPPLPPYIARHAAPSPEDRERYQTVYAEPPGSVAAPTAGLHFTQRLLDRLGARGVEVHALTLHVGVATFRPIRTRRVEAHVLPPERVSIPPAVAGAVNAARAEGRRVVAVGTTTTRALEAAAGAGSVEPCQGAADLYIYPGYRFRVVDALLTNFHLPRTSLLVLVSAFAGRELILKAYRHAVGAGYRFYSYGDATLIQ